VTWSKLGTWALDRAESKNYIYIYMKKLILGFDPNLTRIIPGQQIGTLVLYCKELEEGRKNWLQYKKEATWKHKRVKTQK
jgi:myb proto-oncogene protein